MKARAQIKNFAAPDEQLTFPKGSAATVRLGELVVGRLVQEPGWRWSEHIRPIAGTASCQFHHTGFAISGTMRARMDDGTEFEVGPGDVYDIPPGHDAWITGDEVAVSIIWGGWRGWGKPPVGERILTTLVFTDIAGSTELAARIGDSAWDKLLEKHNDRIRQVVEQHRGVEIATTGDGFLLTFDGAARAVIAADELRRSVHDMDLEIRAAVHTGEVEVVPGNLRGLAVHEAARILGLADAGDVLVSSTTRDLAATAGLRFEDRGEHRLKGVTEPRRVFALARTRRPPDR